MADEQNFCPDETFQPTETVKDKCLKCCVYVHQKTAWQRKSDSLRYSNQLIRKSWRAARGDILASETNHILWFYCCNASQDGPMENPVVVGVLMETHRVCLIVPCFQFLRHEMRHRSSSGYHWFGHDKGLYNSANGRQTSQVYKVAFLK